MARPESVSLNKIKHKKKMTKADIVFYVCVYAFFILFLAVTLYPVFNRLMYSLADRYEIEKGGAFYLFPRMWSLRNYKEMLLPNSWIWEKYREIDFDYPGFLMAAKVTLARTLIGTLTALISNAGPAFRCSGSSRCLFKAVFSRLFRRICCTDRFSFPAASGYTSSHIS